MRDPADYRYYPVISAEGARAGKETKKSEDEVRLERATGFEPATKSLGSSYSTN